LHSFILSDRPGPRGGNSHGLPPPVPVCRCRHSPAACGTTGRRIAIISPYPQPLHQAGLRYWQGAGLEIAYEARIDIGSTDTRAIYRLDGGEAEASIEEAKRQAPDAILLAGTGMPTLRLIDPEGDPPILSSNLCLAASLAAAVETSRVH
jgi:maleate cis-trans isomerase